MHSGRYVHLRGDAVTLILSLDYCTMRSQKYKLTYSQKATVNQDCKLMPEYIYGRDEQYLKCDPGYTRMTEVFCGYGYGRAYCRRAYCCPISAVSEILLLDEAARSNI